MAYFLVQRRRLAVQAFPSLGANFLTSMFLPKALHEQVGKWR